MSEDQGNKEEKFDFTAEGEALGYISLSQATLLAMQSASDAPGGYGRRFRNVRMAFEVVDSSEDEDYYTITLSFRPQGVPALAPRGPQPPFGSIVPCNLNGPQIDPGTVSETSRTTSVLVRSPIAGPDITGRVLLVTMPSPPKILTPRVPL